MNVNLTDIDDILHGQLVKTIGKLWKTQTIVLLTEQQREIELGFLWVGFFSLSSLEFGAHSPPCHILAIYPKSTNVPVRQMDQFQ